MNPPDLYEQLARAAEQRTNETRQPADRLAVAPSIALYGAGNVGRDVLRLLTARGWSVRCFLDQNAKPGDQVEGVPVLSLNDPTFDDAARRETLVIISIFNPYVDMAALLARLTELGWRDVMPFIAFHRGFPGELGDRFWLTGLGYYAGITASLRAAARVWSDARSREIYDAVLRFRLEGDPRLLPAPETDCPYFPPDVPKWKTPCRFVDCGAFDGDTLEYMRRTNFPLEAVAAFEPDAGNVRLLAARLQALAAPPTNLETLLWPCAVFSTITQLRFDAGHGTGSKLSGDGKDVIQAVTLDAVLAGFRPTLIKMDIEGAEHDALLGARGLIHRHRPGLAICVYHRAQDLWQIPLLLQSWNLGYRFYLRVHCHNAFELVLYAIPES